MKDLLLYLGPGENEELRYALRTWEQNLRFRKLYVVGCPKPKWFHPDMYVENPLRYNKMRQCYENLIIALQDDRLTDDVLLMMDDIFILVPYEDWTINYNRGTLQTQLDNTTKGGSNSYYRLVENTKKELEKDFTEPLSFEEHAPFLCNRKKMLELLQSYGSDRMPTMLYRSIYGNRYDIPTEYKPDVKLKQYADRVPVGVPMFSTNPGSFKGSGGTYAEFYFKRPSRFEY